MTYKNHYTYRITNIKLKMYYYGARSTNLEPINDLGIIYFSSSTDKKFIKDQKENSQDYKYKVIHIYDNRKNAIKLEVKLHEKFNVGINENFYNKAKQSSSGFDTTGTTLIFSDEHKRKLSESLVGRFYSEETRRKIGAYSKTRIHTEETKRKISENNGKSMLGKHHSKETRRKISESNKNKPIITCPKCGFSGKGASNMKRWHFDNCRI